jgi:hypothetical protein
VLVLALIDQVPDLGQTFKAHEVLFNFALKKFSVVFIQALSLILQQANLVCILVLGQDVQRFKFNDTSLLLKLSEAENELLLFGHPIRRAIFGRLDFLAIAPSLAAI